jgi:hypothetical protein
VAISKNSLKVAIKVGCKPPEERAIYDTPSCSAAEKANNEMG